MDNVKLHIGQRVRVKDSLNFTDRVGTLAPISDHPEDFWDFYVELDAATPAPDATKLQAKLAEARTIGVISSQVVPL